MGNKKCAINGCNNCTISNKIPFHTFPTDEQLKAKWINASGINKGYICSMHFEKKMYNISSVGSERHKLKKDAVPTLYLMQSPRLLEQSRYSEEIDTTKSTSSSTIRNGVTSPHLLALASKILKTKSEQKLNARKELFPSSTVQSNVEITHEPFVIDEIIYSPRTKKMKKQLSVITKKGRPVIIKKKTAKEEVKILKRKLKKIESYNNNLKDDIAKLQQSNSNLENATLHSANRAKSMTDFLSSFFTPGQVSAICMGPDWKKKIRWSAEDISSAISLHSVSPRAYRYLSNKLQYPLPSNSTLCRRSQIMTLRPGFIDDVFSVLKGKAENMTELERIAVISFDEMYIQNRIDFEPQQQQILGPHNCVQVMCVRGLFGRWKQPIFFSFDCDMTDTILNTAISKLYDVGFTVVAFVSDMGPKNRALYSKFNITPEKPYFQHPNVPGGKIFCFADVPHLLKLIRNHLIDSGFLLADGRSVNRKPLDSLLKIQTSQLKPGWKLSQHLLDVKGSERQNVKVAAKLLSRNTAKALLFIGDSNLFINTEAQENYKVTSAFVELTNDWFDVHNSINQFGPQAAYGQNLYLQNEVLNKMSAVIEGIRVKKHYSMLPFQHGILISNSSLIQLLSYIQMQYSDIRYILTRRLNQDILENLFSYLRAMGHTCDNPGPLDFIHRLKKYILGKHSASVLSIHKNTEDDVRTDNLSADFLSSKNNKSINEINKTVKDNEDEIVLTQEIFNSILDGKDIIFEDDCDIEHLDLTNITSNIVTMAGLEYVAGFVAHHFKSKYPSLSMPSTELKTNPTSPNWIQYVSRGNLTVPHETLVEVSKVMEHEFVQFHGDLYSKKINIIDTVVENIKKYYTNLPIPEEVLKYLVRTRTFILVRTINTQYKQKYNTAKTKIKKISKVINIIPKEQRNSTSKSILISPMRAPRQERMKTNYEEKQFKILNAQKQQKELKEKKTNLIEQAEKL